MLPARYQCTSESPLTLWSVCHPVGIPVSFSNTCDDGWSTPCPSMDNIRIVSAARGPPIHTVVHRQALQSTLQTDDFIGCRVWYPMSVG